MILAGLALLWSPVALAVDVYVNGVQVNGLKDQVLEEVTVTFDADGDVRIDAPNVSVGRSSVAVVPEPEPPPLPEAAVASNVPPGRWWLVSADDRSQGVEIDVRLNGDLVRVIRSGEAQVLVDLAPYLHRGPNQVTLTARSQGRQGSRILTVYLGSGDNVDGVLELDSPEVTFAPDKDEVRDGVTRVFSLTID